MADVDTEPRPSSERPQWRQRAAADDVIARVASGLGIPSHLARLMVVRGVEGVDDGRAYLHPSLKDLPDPARLAGVDAAVARLIDAMKRRETIGIFGDYDVDGVTSSTVLAEFLEELGVTVVLTLPDRLKEGYGLSRLGVDRLRDAGASLVVTVDCGVTAHDEVAYANSRDIDVIVIDHHTVPVVLPSAVAVINPHRADCLSDATHLCAVGVTFNVCLELRRTLRDLNFFTSSRPEPDLRRALDLVALGTIADVVPLVRDNRILVHAGVRMASQGARPGLRALLEVANIDEARLRASDFGFQIGPRINAAGRLGDAMQAVQLLRASSSADAKQLAERLDAENASRRDLEKRITDEAIKKVESADELSRARVIAVYDEGWHPGVVGIVASRLVDRFGRPAVVVGDGGRGSGRSIPAFHLFDALSSCADALDGFGGHQHAAGVRVKAGAFDRFRDAFLHYGNTTLTDDDLKRTVSYDGELAIDDVDQELCTILARAAPFGRMNSEPVFRFNGVRPSALRELNGGHFKATLRERPRVEAIRFGDAARMPEFAGIIDVVGMPELNVWRGTTSVQIRVKDFAQTGEMT